MTPEKKDLIALANESCKDCGWYHDCPMGYKCPPLEILIELIIETPEEKE